MFKEQSESESPLDGILRAISSIAVILSCVAAAYELYGVFADERLPRVPHANLPTAVAIVLFYGAIVVLIFSFLTYIGRSNGVLLLLGPIVGFAMLWFSLGVRDYLFGHWLSTLDFDKLSLHVSSPGGTSLPGGTSVEGAHRDYYYLCENLKEGHFQPEFDVWRFLALFHLQVMSVTILATVLLLVLRLFGKILNTRGFVGLTGFVVVLGLLLALFSRYYIAVLSIPYRSTVDVYVGKGHIIQGSIDIERDFWKFGCHGQ
jgi:hypothetical protein